MELDLRSVSPLIWAHIRGRYWSAKIDDISLRPLDLQGVLLTGGWGEGGWKGFECVDWLGLE
jgi:hypothetical protein